MPAPMPSGVDAIRAFLDQHGPDTVRSMLTSGGLPPQFNSVAYRWLAEKEQEVEECDRYDRAAGFVIAERAAIAAEHQATEVDLAATTAEKANMRATIALVLAVSSIVISIAIPILLAH